MLILYFLLKSSTCAGKLALKMFVVKKKTSTRVFVTVFVKICLLLTNTCACQELNNLKLTLKVVIKINNYENTQSEIRIFCLQSKV